jgi:sugar phosphate isomerase/epimerase
MAAADWSRQDPRLRARLMEALGGVAWWQGDIRAMKPAYREAVEIWRTMDEPAELANALYNYSFSFSVPDEPTADLADPDPEGRGRAALEEALAIYQSLGDERGEANVLWGMGNMRYFAAELDSGLEIARRALEKFRRVGDRTMEAWSLHMVGGALLRAMRLDEARDHLRHALRHFYEASDTAGITLVLDDLSSQALADGDPERAARIWGAARNLTTATGANLATFVDGWIEQQVRPSVRKTLESEDLARLAREGAAMALDDAVAYALDVPVAELARGHAPEPVS